MNRQMAIIAFLFVMAAFIVSVPVSGESIVAKSDNLNQSDNLETKRRLIARLTYIKELAIENLKKIAPREVEQTDYSLEQVKQFLDTLDKEGLVTAATAAAILQSASPPKTPLISPLQTR